MIRDNGVMKIVLGAAVFVGGVPCAGPPPADYQRQLKALQPQLEKLNAMLLPHPDVHGTAIGLTPSSPGPDPVIQPVKLGLVAFVSVTFPGADAFPGAPPFRPVVTGGFAGLAENAEDHAAPRERASPIGVSTSHANVSNRSGSIGCRLTDGNRLWLLSNNHAIAALNHGKPGEYVLQPGRSNRGAPRDRVAVLHDFVRLDVRGDNYVDAAIACTAPECLATASPMRSYGRPKPAIQPPYPGLEVRKHGRKTGRTDGVVAYLMDSVKVRLWNDEFCFRKQIGIRSVENGPVFADQGDSGSLVVSGEPKTEAYSVGLYFAQDPDTGLYLANPMEFVIKQLGYSQMHVDGQMSEIGQKSQDLCDRALADGCKNLKRRAPDVKLVKLAEERNRRIDRDLERLRSRPGVLAATCEPCTKTFSVVVSADSVGVRERIKVMSDKYDVRRYLRNPDGQLVPLD